MSSEDLNNIPKKCDENKGKPHDQPGVTVSDKDDDDKDGRPTAAALQLFRSPGGDISDKLERAEDVDFWGLEWPGGPIELTITSADDLAWVVLADLQGQPVAGGVAASPTFRTTAPPGRYLVKIFFGPIRRTPLNYHVVSNRPT